jgi:hypothetical protein
MSLNVPTTFSGPVQPSKNHADRVRYIEGCEEDGIEVGVLVQILRPSDGKSTSIVNTGAAGASAAIGSQDASSSQLSSTELRFIDTSLGQNSFTGTVRLATIRIPAEATKNVIRNTLHNYMEEIFGESINWEENELFTIRVDKIAVPKDGVRKGTKSTIDLNKCTRMVDNFIEPKIDIKFIPSYALLPRIDDRNRSGRGVRAGENSNIIVSYIGGIFAMT